MRCLRTDEKHEYTDAVFSRHLLYLIISYIIYLVNHYQDAQGKATHIHRYFRCLITQRHFVTFNNSVNGNIYPIFKTHTQVVVMPPSSSNKILTI
jgi:hypothetical protein